MSDARPPQRESLGVSTKPRRKCTCPTRFTRTRTVSRLSGETIQLAGGGVRPGVRIGATDEFGLMAVDRPTPFRDLHATILAALGLHCDALAFESNGRKERLTGVAGAGKPIDGVLAS